MLGQIKLVDKTSHFILKWNQSAERGLQKHQSLTLTLFTIRKDELSAQQPMKSEQKQKQLKQNKIFLGFYFFCQKSALIEHISQCDS